MTNEDLDQATEGLKSKSDKIRRLHELGVPPARIADHLGIRYQFAYNVIHDGRKKGSKTVNQGTSVGISIEEAKRELALRFGVQADAIEITIRG